jgi:hypothetical protein
MLAPVYTALSCADMDCIWLLCRQYEPCEASQFPVLGPLYAMKEYVVLPLVECYASLRRAKYLYVDVEGVKYISLCYY